MPSPMTGDVDFTPIDNAIRRPSEDTDQTYDTGHDDLNHAPGAHRVGPSPAPVRGRALGTTVVHSLYRSLSELSREGEKRAGAPSTP